MYTAGAQIETWLAALTDEQQHAVLAAIELLEDRGPSLGRPIVDRVQGSRHHKTKELRPPGLAGSVLRVLFAFDSERRGARLIGGDKAEDSRWNRWYDTWIPVADDLLDQIEDRLAKARRETGTEETVHSRGVTDKRGGRRWTSSNCVMPWTEPRLAVSTSSSSRISCAVSCGWRNCAPAAR